MGKQLGWGCNLGGAESLWISKVGHTVLARLMESQIWHVEPTSTVGEGLAKGQWPLLALMPDTSVSLSMLVPFKVLPQCWSSKGLSLNK